MTKEQFDSLLAEVADIKDENVQYLVTIKKEAEIRQIQATKRNIWPQFNFACMTKFCQTQQLARRCVDNFIMREPIQADDGSGEVVQEWFFHYEFIESVEVYNCAKVYDSDIRWEDFCEGK